MIIALGGGLELAEGLALVDPWLKRRVGDSPHSLDGSVDDIVIFLHKTTTTLIRISS